MMKDFNMKATKLAMASALLVFSSAGMAKPKQKKNINLQQAAIDMCTQEMLYFKMASKSHATKYCKCKTNVMARDLKLGEFWKMQTYIFNNKDPYSIPAVKRMAPKIKACRKGLKLRPPQAPARPKK